LFFSSRRPFFDIEVSPRDLNRSCLTCALVAFFPFYLRFARLPLPMLLSTALIQRLEKGASSASDQEPYKPKCPYVFCNPISVFSPFEISPSFRLHVVVYSPPIPFLSVINVNYFSLCSTIVSLTLFLARRCWTHSVNPNTSVMA